jgi:phosphoglycerol geranylgeranyltransferase
VNAIGSWLAEKKRKLHFTLIDPDKQTPQQAAKIARDCASYGTDAIMLGGSTAGREHVDATAAAIREAVSLPVILFPGSSRGITKHADYIFFMSLLNSKRRKLLVEEQVEGSLFIKKSGIKPIGMGYLVVSTSKTPTTVEKIADLDAIKEGESEKLLKYALAAEYFGMSCVYLEAGSGAEKPVPDEMIRRVRENLSIPIIVGGGIRDAKTAVAKISAGADVIVTGTLAEKDTSKVKEIIEAVKGYKLL